MELLAVFSLYSLLRAREEDTRRWWGINIVVNSVMSGFSAEMHERLHGLASDVMIECHATGGMPDPDLLIRTGGEQRLSNYLLWQCAYTEFVFLPVYWPDFDEKALDDALNEYAARDRRFGGVEARA